MGVPASSPVLHLEHHWVLNLQGCCTGQQYLSTILGAHHGQAHAAANAHTQAVQSRRRQKYLVAIFSIKLVNKGHWVAAVGL